MAKNREGKGFKRKELFYRKLYLKINQIKSTISSYMILERERKCQQIMFPTFKKKKNVN